VPDHQELVRVHHIGDPVELTQIGLEPLRHAERLVAARPWLTIRSGPVARRDLRHVVGRRDAAAPGMLTVISAGLPGMCLPMKRAMRRVLLIVIAAEGVRTMKRICLP